MKNLDPDHAPTDGSANPEGAVGRSDEDTTPVDPHTGEEAAESEGKPEVAPTGTDTGSDESGAEGASEPREPKEDPDSVEVFFEDEEPSPEPPKDSAAWARLRKSEQEARKRAAELQRKLDAQTQPPGAPDPGAEPTLEDCDYDQDLLKKRTREYDVAVGKKQAADAEQARKQQDRTREVQALVDGYAAKKAVFSKRVKGYAEAESTVVAMMSPERQDVLLKVTDNPEQLVYALGRRPDKLEELLKENDRDRFVAKLKRLEVSITMKKGTPTPPEERVSGSGNPGPAGSTLERLRAEAAKTGDYSKVNAWKRQQRERSRK
jgi:hypothetical protein